MLIVAPKVGGAKLADGSMLVADGQVAGTPSVLFDAVAVILSDEGAQALSIDYAYVLLRVIATTVPENTVQVTGWKYWYY